MKLRVGMPLVTKNAHGLTNAVVYKLFEGENRSVVYVLSDFGNIMKYSSEEDVLMKYEISEQYTDYFTCINYGLIKQEELDDFFSVRDRIERQVELLTKALEEISK